VEKLTEERRCAAMAPATHVYGEVKNKTHLKAIFRKIRREVDSARVREELTELYRRAGYLITLTQSPSWREKFGDQADELRGIAEAEFGSTARKVNRRAGHLGVEANYDEKWGS